MEKENKELTNFSKPKGYKFWEKTTYYVNGKEIVKPRSYTLLITLAVIALTGLMFIFIPVSGSIRISEIFKILAEMFNPSIGITGSWAGWFKYMGTTVFAQILETINICLIGTLIGSLIAVPFAIFASRNITKKAWIYQIPRMILNFVRTIPTYVLAVLAMLCFGLGAFPGTVATAIFSFGIMGKMFYEQIETIDMGPFESLEASGANKSKAFRFAVVPQVLPVYIGYLIYIFEMNIRGSVILGYVGAGGIGQELSTALDNRYYDRVGAIFVFLLALVIVLQIITSFVRRKLR